MKWFKHDSNAHIDTRIKKLKHKYGIVGYGLYWYCIELIAMNVDGKNISFELEDDAEVIALDWSLDQLKVQEMMMYMVEIGLFDNSNGRITCLKLAKRLDDTNSKNPQIKKLLEQVNAKSVGETPSNSESLRPDKIRLDKNRLEETKDIKPLVAKAPVKQFKPPVQLAVQQYMTERGLDFNQAKNESEKFCDFYISKGWMINKNKMKCWKASARNWLRNYKPTPSAAMDNTGWINDMGDVL